MSEHELDGVIDAGNKDPLEQNLNRILQCRDKNGKKFIAKLIAIRGEELYFQIRSGLIIMNRRENLQYMIPSKKTDEVS